MFASYTGIKSNKKCCQSIPCFLQPDKNAEFEKAFVAYRNIILTTGNDGHSKCQSGPFTGFHMTKRSPKAGNNLMAMATLEQNIMQIGTKTTSLLRLVKAHRFILLSTKR